jgi:gamma-glutamylcysteine synthetase
MLQRLRTLARLRLVVQQPDQRPYASPRSVVHVLAEDTPALLAALDTAPLHPRTRAEQALRALASVLNRSANLAPGTDTHTDVLAAVAGAREAVGQG